MFDIAVAQLPAYVYELDENFAKCEDLLCALSAERKSGRPAARTPNGQRRSLLGTKSSSMHRPIGSILATLRAVGGIRTTLEYALCSTSATTNVGWLLISIIRATRFSSCIF